ncbi:putative phage integrase [Burkholderia pseudomallei]|nr:putative phage integrase [Burkholderia pseudomallei]
MTNHLTKRGSRYYIRRKVPLDLIAHYQGRKEIVKALGTSDPAKARERVREESYRLDQEFSALRLPSGDASQSVELREFILDLVTSESVPTGRTAKLDPRRPGSYVICDCDGEQVAVLWPKDADDAYHKQRLKHARAFAHGVLIARVSGTLPAATPPADAPQQIAPKETHGGASAGHLAALVEKWAGERKPDVRTVNAANLVVERFYTYVGRVPVAAITRAHVVAFKDKLVESGQTPVNTDKQLTVLRALLNFAVANLQAVSNPATGVKVGERKNAKAARLPFDLPALTAIFASTVYVEGARPAGGAGDAAYWLPLLGLLTGARIEELAQLRPEDIYEEVYRAADDSERRCWVMRITDEGEGQGLKNASSVRRVPLHAELLSRGFLDYVRSQRGKPRIFPALKPDNKGAESGNWSKWFSKHLRRQCGVTNPKMVFHSFRHLFKDLCRTSAVPEDVADALQGHSTASASRRYGGLSYPLAPLVEAMGRIRVPGLTLPSPAQ